MTAETHVHEEVAEVSTNSKASVEIQGDQCALDVSSYQDSPKLPVPDCDGNGISNHDENGIARDDAEDNLYAFISRNNDLLPIDSDLKGYAQVSDDSKGVEVQNGEFLNSSASEVDSSWVFEGTEVASSPNCSGDKCVADSLWVAVIGEAAEQNGIVGSADSLPQQPEDHQIDPRSLLTVEEIEECEVGVLVSGADSAHTVSPELAFDVSKPIDVNLKSQENNFESTSEFRDGQESKHAFLDATPCKSSEVGVLGSGTASVGNLAPQPEIALDVVDSSDVNQKSQENNLESTSESGEGRESQYAGLEVTPRSSEVEVSKRNEAQQNPELSDELGGTTHDSQNMHSDSAEYASPQTEVQMVNVEEQSATESTCIMEVRVESKIPLNIPEQSGSYHVDNLDTDGEKLEEETKTQLPSVAKENKETVITLAENGESDQDPGLKIEKSGDEVDLPSETETACSPVLNEKNFPVSSVNDSVPKTKEAIENMDDSEKSLKMQQSSEGTNSLIHAADSYIGEKPVERDENVLDMTREHEAEDKSCPSKENVTANNHEIIKDETGDSDGVAVEIVENAPEFSREHGTECVSTCQTQTENDASTAEEVIEQETEVENSVSGNVAGAVPSSVGNSKSDTITIEAVTNTSNADGDSTSSSANNVNSILEFELEPPDPIEEVATFQSDDVHLKTEVSVVDAEHADMQSVPFEAKMEFEVESSSCIRSIDMPCNNAVASEIDVSDSSVIEDKLPSCAPENIDPESKGEHLSGADLNSDGKLIYQESKNAENSATDAVAGQDVVVEPLMRPFHFLIRMPRFEDLNMKEQIRKAQLLVEEKTQHRDAFRIEVQKYKANCLGHAAEYDAAVSESRALKRSVKAKRAEIDSLQSVITKVKNAISVEDIDSRIYGMEHMIEHETLPLKEEKLFIREIKQLKQLREQLSSNIGSQDEVQQALNNRDQIEERLKVLRKELDSLKDNVLKADAVVRAIEKKYEDENKMVKEVQTQYAAANNVRQEAYLYLQSLRKLLFQKNERFRMYKDKAAAASDYAARRDREALHHLCVYQVESIMELWNKNDEFRKDYVRCNMKSTLRRLGTLDGRSLGPDEQPPVLTSYGDERVHQFLSSPANSSSILQTQHLEQEVAKLVEGVTAGDKATVEELDPKSPTSSPREQEKPTLTTGLATVSGREITYEIREEHMPTEEELELTRKVEELKEEEAEAKLKEQCRLEERAKALVAVERKKRNAEKAQMRAELRAQKEAEQREKEREKRLRKKERKKATTAEVPDGKNSVETSPNCESLTETIKENPPVVSKRPQKPSLFAKQSKAKSTPPPSRNRNRMKIQQWTWVILTCLLVIALFLLGNVGFFSNLSKLRRPNSRF